VSRQSAFALYPKLAPHPRDVVGRRVAVRGLLLGILGEQRILDETFTIDWCFMGGVGGLSSASFQETVDPPSFDAGDRGATLAAIYRAARI